MLRVDPWSFDTRARELLGRAFHTMQDFYSHSTWVEQGEPGIVDFYSLEEFSKFPTDIYSIGAVCDIRGGRIQPDRNLTTGYYPDFPSDPELVGKCLHGEVVLDAIFGPCLSVGINKDRACRGDGFTVARGKAIDETRVFTQSLINSLGEEGNIDGICALMGITQVDCPEVANVEATLPIADNGACSDVVSAEEHRAYFCDFCGSNNPATFDVNFDFLPDGSGRVTSQLSPGAISYVDMTWSCDVEDIRINVTGAPHLTFLLQI